MFLEKKLSNGVRLVIEKLPEIRSVTLGLWVKAGSVSENAQNNGISHFIEHMLFKGTSHRTYKEIASAIDNIGGQINAFTGKECTCFYAKVIDEKQAVAVDVLSDMLAHSLFDEKEMEKEKGVVLEEISMNEDDPEDVAHEQLSVHYFEGSEISKTILGPAENVSGFKKSDIHLYMDSLYTADNIVAVAVGNVDVDALVSELEKKLSQVPIKKTPEKDPLPKGWCPKPSFTYVNKDIEQVNLCIGLKGFAYSDRRKYAMSLVSNVLGGSMSSRLFQNIREEHGIAYSVYSYPSIYTGAGMLSVYAGTSPEKAETVTKEIIKEICDFSITHQELEDNKEQLRGNYILSQESMSSRMNAIGKNMLLRNDYFSEEKILSLISDISMDDVMEASEFIFSMDAMSGVYVGNIKNTDALKAFFC